LLFAVKHAALRRKIKNWLAQNQDNMSERSGMSTNRLLFQLGTTNIPTKLVGLVQRGHYYIFIECYLFSPWYSWKIAHLVLNNNHSFFSPFINSHERFMILLWSHRMEHKQRSLCQLFFFSRINCHSDLLQVFILLVDWSCNKYTLGLWFEKRQESRRMALCILCLHALQHYHCFTGSHQLGVIFMLCSMYSCSTYLNY
jgi:hypothetical protein